MAESKLKKRLYKPDRCELSQSDINHLRRLLGWLRVEYYLDTDFMRGATEATKALLDAGKITAERAEEQHQWLAKKRDALPKYLHASVKALQKTIKQIDGEVSDISVVEVKRIGAVA
jgi:hypothetical protein